MGKDSGEIDQEVDFTQQARRQMGQARDRVTEGIKNPIGMALGAAAVGFLIGLIVPVTTMEENALPQVRDKIEEQINAADIMGRAGRVLDETKRAATHAVQEEARGASEALSAHNNPEQA